MIKDKNGIKKVIENNVYMLKFVQKAAPGFILSSCAISLTALIDTVSNTWFSKIVFDSMKNYSSYMILLYFIFVLLFFLLISSGIKTIFYEKYTPKENQKVVGYIRAFLYDKARSLDYVYYENPEFYNLYMRALAEADQRAIAVLDSISQISYSVITLLTLFSIIIFLDPMLIFFAVIGAILSSIISKKLSELRYKYDYDKVLLERKMEYVNRIFYEPQYAKDMKMDLIHVYFIDFYKKTVDDMIFYIKNRTNKIAFWEFLSGIENVLLQIIMIIFLTYRVYNGIISIGDYAALLNSTFALMVQFQTFFGMIPKFYEHSLYIENFKEIVNKVPDIEKDDGIEIDADKPIKIEFYNVTFSYSDNEEAVLKNISMVFCEENKYAIVGHNGAGKSTIIKLILRLYDVNDGMILVNDVDIKKYNVFSLRKAITTVFQDFQIYAMPMSDYILSRKYVKDIDEEKLNSALFNSGLVGDYRNTYKAHTMLTKEFDDSGLILSGGQNQKLAIAKAIAKEVGTIIMDEASSALDPVSEYEINKKMIQVSKNKTVILISHRLSAVKDADVIYYIESGKVLEKGSHSELMDLNGKYANMFRIQAESYVD